MEQLHNCLPTIKLCIGAKNTHNASLPTEQLHKGSLRETKIFDKGQEEVPNFPTNEAYGILLFFEASVAAGKCKYTFESNHPRRIL